MYPQLIIRSPYAAPFDFCIPCQLVNLSTGQLVVSLAHWPAGQPINSLAARAYGASQLLHRRAPRINRHSAGILDRTLLGIILKDLFLLLNE